MKRSVLFPNIFKIFFLNIDFKFWSTVECFWNIFIKTDIFKIFSFQSHQLYIKVWFLWHNKYPTKQLKIVWLSVWKMNWILIDYCYFGEISSYLLLIFFLSVVQNLLYRLLSWMFLLFFKQSNHPVYCPFNPPFFHIIVVHKIYSLSSGYK